MKNLERNEKFIAAGFQDSDDEDSDDDDEEFDGEAGDDGDNAFKEM